MSPFWMVAWALAYAVTWLLPHHFQPWTTFHTDAWAACTTTLGACALAHRTRGATEVHGLSFVVGACALWPWIQFGFGLLPYAGQAWMTSVYLLGLFCALLIGTKWEQACPGQLPDALFLAILVACVGSVSLQLYTWLGLWDGDLMNPWTMGLALGSRRAFANLGQSNQLATLLLWGVAACLWMNIRKHLGTTGAVALSAYFLLGVALTHSRTATLSVAVAFIAAWFWKPLRQNRALSWTVTGLCGFYAFCMYFTGWLWQTLWGADAGGILRLKDADSFRLAAWSMFIQATLERPWTGFGWTNVATAQMAVVDRLPGIKLLYEQAHNLFIELVVANGIGIGLLLVVILLHWYWKSASAIRTLEEAAIFMLLSATCIHALLELPLHYAYFLLPIGMFIGVLNVRIGMPVLLTCPKSITLGIWLTGCLAAFITMRDYVHVESSYTALRFEFARIGTRTAERPHVWVLTDQREKFDLAKLANKDDIRPAQLARLEALVAKFPTPYLVYRTAAALARHGRDDDARRWLSRVCKITPNRSCALYKGAWLELGQTDARIGSIAWLETD